MAPLLGRGVSHSLSRSDRPAGVCGRGAVRWASCGRRAVCARLGSGAALGLSDYRRRRDPLRPLYLVPRPARRDVLCPSLSRLCRATPGARVGEEGMDAFRRGAESIGGEPIAVGNAGYSFQVLPRICLAAVYWLGDEDFSSQASILFEDTAGHYMSTDGLAVLGSHLVNKLLLPLGVSPAAGNIPAASGGGHGALAFPPPLRALRVSVVKALLLNYCLKNHCSG